MKTYRIVFSQEITEEYVLSFFEGSKLLAKIPLGSIEDEARDKANGIIGACKENEQFDDQS